MLLEEKAALVHAFAQRQNQFKVSIETAHKGS